MILRFLEIFFTETVHILHFKAVSFHFDNIDAKEYEYTVDF